MERIEQEAVAAFVEQAKAVTPEQRQVVLQRLQSFIGRGERPIYKEHKVGDEAIQSVIAQIAAMDTPAPAETQPEPAQQPGTATVRIDPKNFARGVKYAKQFGGTYNPASKTWSIPLTRENVRNSLRAPAAYGLIIVEGT